MPTIPGSARPDISGQDKAPGLQGEGLLVLTKHG